MEFVAVEVQREEQEFFNLYGLAVGLDFCDEFGVIGIGTDFCDGSLNQLIKRSDAAGGQFHIVGIAGGKIRDVIQ